MKGLTPTELSQLTRKSFWTSESLWNGNQRSPLRKRVEARVFRMPKGERFTSNDLAKLCKSRLDKVRGVIYKLAEDGHIQRAGWEEGGKVGKAIWERV